MQDFPTTAGAVPESSFPAKKPGWVRTAAILTAAIGLVVLFGWAFDIDALKRVLPGLVTMKANTAAAFVLSGLCLYLQTRHPITHSLLLARRISASLVLLVGLATLGEYQFGWNLGIDQLLFRETPNAVLTSHPGRMSNITAINFALAGAALLFVEARLWAMVQAAALATMGFALMPLGGYIFGNLMLTRIGEATSIAAHTVTAFLILATGIMTATRNHGLTVLLRKKSRTFGVTASLAMLAFVFAAASYNTIQKDKASQWVEHTYQVIHAIELFSDSLHDFLYHNRGFLLSGDDVQLQERGKRREALLAIYANMRQLTTDNPLQHERLETLNRLVMERIERADQAVQVRREKGLIAAASTEVGGKEGIVNLHDIEMKLAELKDTELDLLRERQKVAEIMSASSLFTLAIMLTFSMLLMLWAHRASQREISERKRMQQEIAQSEVLFRNYFELGQIGMAITSLEKGWLRVNSRLCEMLGYTKEELFKLTWAELTHPDDLQPDLVQFDKLVSGETDRYSMDKRFIRKDGSIVHTYLAVTCQRKPDGSPDYVIASLQDITERKQMEDDLAQERLFLSTLLDNIAEAVVACDDQGLLTRFNQAARDLHGLPEQHIAPELWGNYYDLYQADGKTPLRKEAIPLFRALQGERVRDAEMAVIQKGGTAHFLVASGQPMRAPGGKLLGAVVTMHDITERKQAEKELREKEERLALATTQNGVGVWDWNLITQQMIWDDSMYALYHIRREDFIGTEEAWRKALHPDDLHRGDREVSDAIAGIKPFNTEFRVVWPGGEIRHIKAVAKVFRDEKGTPLRMLGINMDITELKQVEAALRTSEERLHSIIQTSMDGIVQMDAEGYITGWNSQMENIFGWPRAGAIGQALHETIIPHEHREAHTNGLKRFLLTGEERVLSKRIEVEGLHRDGHIFPVELTVTPILMDGKYEFSAFLRDITEAKRAKEEIYRLNEELEQRVMERTAKLEAANKDMESFSYSISHDLRAPLRAINGFSKMLQEDYVDRLDDEGRRLLRVVADNAHKMGELIDDILAFSRAGRNEIERSPIDMKNLLSGVWEELEPERAGRNIQLETGELPPVEGDPSMVRQVIYNLLVNAVKFTRPRADARIEVSGHVDGRETVYHVRDNGVGFDMQYADNLFGVFRRLHSMEEFEGTGIGLAIVKRIVVKHGGRVWAEGRLNEGATLYFALPNKGKSS